MRDSGAPKPPRSAGAFARSRAFIQKNVALFLIRRRTLRALRSLGMRSDSGFKDLVNAVERELGVTIHLIAAPMPRTVSGLCATAETEYVALANSNDSEAQQRHSWVHEVWHLYLGHKMHDLDDLMTVEDLLTPKGRSALSLLPPDLVDEVLGQPALQRSCYHNEDEEEAEYAARIIVPLLHDGNTHGAMTGTFANRGSAI